MFSSQKTNCSFTLRAKYQRVKDKGDQQVKGKGDQQVKDKKDDIESSEFLEITLLNLIHNHPPSVSIISYCMILINYHFFYKGGYKIFIRCIFSMIQILSI